jgi:MFS family permease
MSKAKSFKSYGAAIWIIGFFMMYFYSGLQNDHLNILTPYATGTLGLSNTAATNPVTIAGFVVIPATVILGTLFLKFSVVKLVAGCAAVLGLSTIGLAYSGGNLVVYSVCLFLVRLLTLSLQMGIMMLCANWFIKLRGRALGFVTIGAPVNTATLIPILTFGVATIGFQASYTIIGIIVLALAVAIILFIKSTPEEVGLYPDGGTESAVKTEEKKMTLIEVLKVKESWYLIISFGILTFCINAVMAFYVPRLIMTGSDPAVFLAWLSVAALLGMPISYILGWVDDKFGTIIACLILAVTFFAVLFALLFMTANNIPLLFLATIGVAGMTGGTPNLHPSSIMYVFGRENYQAANRWIMAIQSFIMAFSIFFMARILDTTGSLDLGYKIMIGMVVVAIIFLVLIGLKPDHDRGNLSAAKKK